MDRFQGYSAFVTGGAQGIGAAVVRRLLGEGARIVVADVDEGAAHKAFGDVSGVRVVRCDVGDADSVAAAVAYAGEEFGRLDVLVNNAFAPDRAEDTDDEWREQFDVTLLGAVRCARAAMPLLAAAGGRGAIVNIGSVNAEAYFGNHAYSAAKAGLASFTRTLAGEAAPLGVRVNQVTPGTIATRGWESRPEQLAALAERVYPLGRVGKPEDVAAAVAFLASGDAAWVTGTTLRVDGGLLAVNTHFSEVLGEF
ncbi:SDR family NAD(P)-dependent oxidoreductase [Streptomyces sp. NPDC026092]|uniref:SDR family NAD(P)-dependent oxidoreductase n=1 Tax=Streptomyces sp. NPDC026092 TaxID=3154797 RepID=UPI0033DC235B